MSKGKIKSSKWYRWFWLPERRKVKFMQVIYDHYEPEIEERVRKKIHDHLIYGKPLKETKDET